MFCAKLNNNSNYAMNSNIVSKKNYEPLFSDINIYIDEHLPHKRAAVSLLLPLCSSHVMNHSLHKIFVETVGFLTSQKKHLHPPLNYNPDAPCKDEIQQRRKEKIEFLGKVMYEYLERAVYNRFPITEQKVRWKAVEVKECIAVENFNLTDAWLAHFQKLYNIPSFDLDTLRNNMCINEVKRPYLNAIDMIQYVSRKEQQQLKDAAENNDICSNDNSMSEEQEETNETRVVYVNDENDENDDGEVKVFNNLQQKHINGQPLEKTTGSLKRSLSPLPDIESVEDALRHVKALEEYAMLRDNYRAIGLLTQLEDIFKKQIRKM
uniref:HTH CENPB-type domain-containing protein n=1 Tax=Glossina brevipalpis TaxID=37001 RepID=A0A1A9WHC4_9MUSC